MGLGGYLAARTDRDQYEAERQREMRETVEFPEVETEEVAGVFRDYGMDEKDIAPGGRGHLLRPEALGGFHDAVRAGVRRARPAARAQQRHHHRGCVYRRRPGAARSLHALGSCSGRCSFRWRSRWRRCLCSAT